MCIDRLSVKSTLHDYSVLFKRDGSFIKELAKIENAVFVVDKNVWSYYEKNLFSELPVERVIIQEAREELKNIETVCELYSRIMRFAPRKNMILISIGGGIIQDITGFVASTLYRGIKWFFVPTTLLAQVDSCIGAKTSLNFSCFKNLIGTFYPPYEIYLYPTFLKSLTREDFYSGVGEITKLHLMTDKSTILHFIKQLSFIDKRDDNILIECIHRCLSIKKTYIEEDEFDTGKRNLLNYGHCFGHAIESSTHFVIPHGQAVVIGMILANKIAVQRGLLSQKQEDFIYKNILKPSLQINIPHIDITETLKAMRQDKKNTGKDLALILLQENGELRKIVDLTEEEARGVLFELQSQFVDGWENS